MLNNKIEKEKKKKKKKGFTLIELLVVIAIIGILAGILVIAINPKEQTGKADDVAKKGNLKQVETISILYLDNESDYTDFCDDPKINILVNEVSGVCYDSDEDWAIETTLSGETGEARYCIDSSGHAGDTSSPLGNEDTSCNH